VFVTLSDILKMIDMKTMHKIFFPFVIAACITSCGEPDYPQPLPVATTQSSRLLVVHTYSGGPRVKVKIDNKISEKDTLRFESAPDGKFYNNLTLAVPAGPNRLISIADLENENYLTDRYTAASGIGVGNTSFITFSVVNETEVPSVVRVSDDLSAPDPGFAKVRFLNFSPDAGEVKITANGGATTVFSLRKFKEVSRKVGNTTTEFNRFSSIAILNYPESTSSTVNYEVRSATDEVLLAINGLKLDSKGIYTIYLKGSVAGESDYALNYGVIKH
jgi:hypothetical protein